MEAKEYVEGLVEKARVAQKVIEGYTQEQVDVLCREIAKTVYDNAELLARMAVDETRMGVYENKVSKNMGKARVIWNDMKHGKSVGIINRYPEKGIIEVAKPHGCCCRYYSDHQSHCYSHVQRYVCCQGT